LGRRFGSGYSADEVNGSERVIGIVEGNVVVDGDWFLEQ
jgi:hypothetical protein